MVHNCLRARVTASAVPSTRVTHHHDCQWVTESRKMRAVVFASELWRLGNGRLDSVSHCCVLVVARLAEATGATKLSCRPGLSTWAVDLGCGPQRHARCEREKATTSAARSGPLAFTAATCGFTRDSVRDRAARSHTAHERHTMIAHDDGARRHVMESRVRADECRNTWSRCRVDRPVE